MNTNDVQQTHEAEINRLGRKRLAAKRSLAEADQGIREVIAAMPVEQIHQERVRAATGLSMATIRQWILAAHGRTRGDSWPANRKPRKKAAEKPASRARA